jgi:biotin-(acetyl-CoA carboxylase) ligase
LAGKNIDRDCTLKILVQHADDLYQKVSRGDSLLDEWSTLVDTVGQQVSVAIGDPQNPERVVKGIAEGIGEFGRLMVRDGGGRLWPLMAGDVSLSASGLSGDDR